MNTKFIYFLIATLFCLGFGACSNDDEKEKENGSNSNIVGKWGLVHKYSKWGTRAGSSGENDSDIAIDSGLYYELTFTADGKLEYVYYDWRGKTTTENYSYSQQGRSLKITSASSVERTYNILTLTADTLLMECNPTSSEYERETFKRLY